MERFSIDAGDSPRRSRACAGHIIVHEALGQMRSPQRDYAKTHPRYPVCIVAAQFISEGYPILERELCEMMRHLVNKLVHLNKNEFKNAQNPT